MSSERLKFVSGIYMCYLGIPGNGKSTELKKLVQKIRDSGKPAYYLSLRRDKDDRNYINVKELAKKTEEMVFLLKGLHQPNQHNNPS